MTAEIAEPARLALQGLRSSIDNLDAALVYILSERFERTRQVGELKGKYGLPSADPTRETELLDRLGTIAAQAGLDADFVERLLSLIMAEVREQHARFRARSVGGALGDA
jgi:chorismate mutase